MILTNCASNTLATVRTAGHPDLSLSGVTSKCGEDLDHGQGCGYNDAAPEPGTGRGRPRLVVRATGSLEWKPVPGHPTLEGTSLSARTDGKFRIVVPTWRPRHGSREPTALRQIGATNGPGCMWLLAQGIGVSC